MSLFSEAVRLLRTKWKNADLLAKELATIFRTDQDIELTEPLTITENGNKAPITIIQRGDSPWPAINVIRGDETIPINFTPGTSGGGLDLGGVPTEGGDPEGVPIPSNNPITLVGVVQSKVSGNVYAVKCYAKDPAGGAAFGVFNVTQGQIDPDDTIPPGTVVTVIAFPVTNSSTTTIASAWMQVPVFLPRV